ncbi:MAG: hypothetical protein EOP84_08885 [Verrucomicrobiaceae bacterium]|nr:MAG: hypothetical protein EOP84_08885 [Verrucomicrobiaceae bacterium]
MRRSKVQDSSYLLAALVWLALFLGCHAEEGSDPASWRIWMEPKFMRAPVSAPVAQAERTVLAAGTLREGELHLIPKSEWDALGNSWETFSVRARANAAADLATLKPEYVRNRKKVIEYAILRSEQPIVASAILAPKFLSLFEETLGPKVLVTVPNRYTAYIFPALVTNYADYAPMIFRDYRATPFPVSIEVFEFSKQGIKAVGAYEEP